MTATEKAIRIRQLLGEACSLLIDLDTGRTDAESKILYGWLTAVADVRFAITETPAIGAVYDRQAVIDAGL